MPKGSEYPGPPEALERYLAVVEASGNGELKGAKNPYTSRNGHMFSFLDPEGRLALRLSDELEAEFRQRHDSGPVEQYGTTMRGYSSVPDELAADVEACAQWYDRAWHWIGTLDPKPTRKPPAKKATAGKAGEKAKKAGKKATKKRAARKRSS